MIDIAVLPTMEPRLRDFIHAVNAGTVTHHELATLLIEIVTDEHVDYDATVATLHRRCPTQEALTRFLRGSVGRFLVESMVENTLVAAFRASEPDECGANMNGHQYGAHGPAGEQQCRWCGDPKPEGH